MWGQPPSAVQGAKRRQADPDPGLCRTPGEARNVQRENNGGSGHFRRCPWRGSYQGTTSVVPASTKGFEGARLQPRHKPHRQNQQRLSRWSRPRPKHLFAAYSLPRPRV